MAHSYPLASHPTPQNMIDNSSFKIYIYRAVCNSASVFSRTQRGAVRRISPALKRCAARE